MNKLLEAIKKFLKIALIVVLVFFGGIALYTGFDNYKDKVARTVDEEIGFKCLVEEKDKNIRFILSSTPNSRNTETYYAKGSFIGYAESEINETVEAKLIDAKIQERTVDYIYLNAGVSNFKLNRKNLELSSLSFNGTFKDKDYTVKQVYQCAEVEPQEIRDVVKNKNAEANSTNKV